MLNLQLLGSPVRFDTVRGFPTGRLPTLFADAGFSGGLSNSSNAFEAAVVCLAISTVGALDL